MGHTFLPGDEAWYATDSPTSQFSAVFEDDGDTGYFYAWDRAREEGSILDARRCSPSAMRPHSRSWKSDFGTATPEFALRLPKQH
jgi:hypothetical protein